jgi:hypothetical protein
VATDGNGNVVVTGFAHNESNQFYVDIYTAKHAGSDGTRLWQKRFAQTYVCRHGVHSALTVDENGNVVVAGTHLGCGIGEAPYAYIARYAEADGALLWEHSFPGKVSAVTTDTGGNAVIAGHWLKPGTGEGWSWLWSVAKFSKADGSLLWEIAGPDTGEATAVVVDGSDNVIVTGNLEGFFMDFYTAKYASSDGSLIWGQRTDAGYAQNLAQAVAVDASGDVVVSGHPYQGALYTAKYAGASGALRWEERYNRHPFSYNFAQTLALDRSGNVVVTGIATDGGAVGECLTIKYASTGGTPLWEQHCGPAHEDIYPPALKVNLALAPDDSVIVTGTSDGDFATVKYVMTQVTYPTPVVLSLALPPEGARLRFTGDAGRTYRLQRASDPSGPWTTFATLTAPPDGAVEHLDPAPPAAPAFYRIAAP